jgi:hypothetical protein
MQTLSIYLCSKCPESLTKGRIRNVKTMATTLFYQKKIEPHQRPSSDGDDR